jgi:hypothetical protein
LHQQIEGHRLDMTHETVRTGSPKHWSARRLAPRMNASAVSTTRTWVPWRHSAHSLGKRMGTCGRFERA